METFFMDPAQMNCESCKVFELNSPKDTMRAGFVETSWNFDAFTKVFDHFGYKDVWTTRWGIEAGNSGHL